MNNQSATNPVNSVSESKAVTRLLTASGVLAIGLTAFINSVQYGLGSQLILFIVFAAVFVALANPESIALSRQSKMLGLLILLLLSVSIWFIAPSDINSILTVVMMAQAPYAISKRQCWLLILVVNLAFLAVHYVYLGYENIIFGWASMFALQAFATTSSLARVEEASLKLQLQEQNAELVAARSALAQKSQMEERLRIAGDLHDSIGHQLTALRLQLEALAQMVPKELKGRVAASQQLSGELLENIRSIVKRMSYEEPTNLKVLIEQIEADTPGVNISLLSQVPFIDPALQQQLVSCIKEGVSNAIRHGGAGKIEITFEAKHLLIDDNGKGIADGNELGFGLNNLMLRLAPFGGVVALTQREPRGSRLSIKLRTGLLTEADQ
jgi:signal transduction histidine kinase